MQTIPEIIKAAGGARGISEASEGAIQKDAVYKWPVIGIPDRHWELLIKLSNATPEELYEANLRARKGESAPTANGEPPVDDAFLASSGPSDAELGAAASEAAE